MPSYPLLTRVALSFFQSCLYYTDLFLSSFGSVMALSTEAAISLVGVILSLPAVAVMFYRCCRPQTASPITIGLSHFLSRRFLRRSYNRILFNRYKTN